jgi:hypothetical protein
MTIVGFVVYAFLALTTVFSPATGHVHATVNTNTGPGVSVTVVQAQTAAGVSITTSAL